MLVDIFVILCNVVFLRLLVVLVDNLNDNIFWIKFFEMLVLFIMLFYGVLLRIFFLVNKFFSIGKLVLVILFNIFEMFLKIFDFV